MGGGLMGLILYGINDNIKNKKDFESEHLH
jgi:hypothetical protein